MLVYLQDDKVLIDGGNVAVSEDCCCGCTSCDDLPPTNPLGPPVHINIVRTLSGTCGTGTVAGSQTYDLDLGFVVQGPVGGHIFCAHDVATNSFGAFWTGSFTCNGDPLWNSGFGGLLGRDFTDCTWWFNLDPFTIVSCGGCPLSFASIFKVIAGPGDPSGVYVFTETVTGMTMTTTVTIT